MNQCFKAFAVGLLIAVAAPVASAEHSYDVADFYSAEKVQSGTKAVGRNDRMVDVEYILTPTKVDTGKYIVKVKKIGDNLYLVRNSDLCIETRYCYQLAPYSEEVVLIVDSRYGYTKGKLIFD